MLIFVADNPKLLLIVSSGSAQESLFSDPRKLFRATVRARYFSLRSFDVAALCVYIENRPSYVAAVLRCFLFEIINEEK